MFLYLSKLLPLFFYPLGLATVALMVAVVTLCKRPRTSAVAMSLALGLLLFCGNVWVAQSLVMSLERQYLPQEPIPNADAIVVLGGATKSADYPRPSVDLAEAGDRIIYAAQLYRQNKAPVIIVSGGRISWFGGSYPESASMADILTFIGIPDTAIIQESASLNTYDNAVNVKNILENRNLNKVILVTSALHMPRSLKIFQRQGINAIPAPTDFLVSQVEWQAMSSTPKAAILNLLPDVQNLGQFTSAMKEYIGLLVYSLRGWL